MLFKSSRLSILMLWLNYLVLETKNLEINYDGRKIYNKINGYGPFNEKSAIKLIQDLKELTNQ